MMSLSQESGTFEATTAHGILLPKANPVEVEQRFRSPKILRIHPVDAGATLRAVDSDPFVFGRAVNCEVVVGENSASRRHAKIIRKGEKWFLVDLGSTNGTWVNEKAVQIQQLNSGDRIRIGRWTYKFFDEHNVEAQYHESVYQMMTEDVLTGAWNKRYLKDVLKREIFQHRRSQQPLSLLMIDFDRFKEINDSHSHLVGDEVLSEFGKRIRTTTRNGDVFARFGGDEFAILFVNSDRNAAREASERAMMAVVREPFLTSVGSLACSISGGFAVCKPGEILSAEELLEAADRNLIEAKNAGRNRIVG